MSHSEVDSFNSCERKHFYAFADGGLQSKSLSDALTRGIIGHKVLEIFFKNLKAGSSYDVAAKAAKDWITLESIKPNANLAMIADVMRLVDVFLDYWRSRILSWNIVHVEDEFWLNVSDRIRFPFKPDLIIKEEGILTVVDYKFVYDFYNDATVNILGQIPKYVGALRAIGIPIKKGLYAQLRHRKMKDMSAPNIMRMDQVPLGNIRVMRTFKEQIATTERIAAYKELTLEEWSDRAIRVANNMVCKSCSFRDLCIAELNGSDGKLMRRVDFESNTYGYHEAEE